MALQLHSLVPFCLSVPNNGNFHSPHFTLILGKSSIIFN
jgi:hypothetical protein